MTLTGHTTKHMQSAILCDSSICTPLSRNITVTIAVPSCVQIFDTAVLRTVGRIFRSVIEQFAYGRFADKVSGTSGHVSTRGEGLEMSAEVDFRPRSMLAENVHHIFPHDVPTSVQQSPQDCHRSRLVPNLLYTN